MRKKTTQNKNTFDVPAFSYFEVKRLGKVYTPYSIVDSKIEQFDYLKDINITVCDPSMGQGNYLRRIFECRLQQLNDCNAIFKNIYGFELDKEAVGLAKEYFLKQGVSQQLVDTHLICGDTTIIYKNFLNTFDVVVGNPPYVKSPLIANEYIKLRSNLVDVFFEIGIDMLKDGGKLLYIIQDSFFTNENSELRDYLLKHNILTIEHRYDFSKIFRKHDIAVDIGLVEVQKNVKQKKSINARRHTQFTIDAAHIKNKWLIFPDEILNINTALLQKGRPLTDFCNTRKGRLINNKGQRIPSVYNSNSYSNTATDNLNVAVLGERNTDYYFPKTLSPTLFTHYVDISKKRKIDNIPTPFIILPYYTGNFRFCLIEEDVFASPLLWVIYGEDLDVLLPILNSTVVDFLIRMNTKSRDTSFEFKTTTFNETIVIPELTEQQKVTLKRFTKDVKNGNVTTEVVDQYVCSSVYTLTDNQIILIKEAQSFWLKKHVKRRSATPKRI